jgi:hypothetical protein
VSEATQSLQKTPHRTGKILPPGKCSHLPVCPELYLVDERVKETASYSMSNRIESGQLIMENGNRGLCPDVGGFEGERLYVADLR